MTAIAEFIDVSSNNDHPIDWAAVKASGITAVVVKATEGTGYVNPNYLQDVDGAEAAGIPAIAYHYAGWGDVGAELEHFLSVAGSRARILDGETTINDPWTFAFLEGLPGARNQKAMYGTYLYLTKGYPALTWVASYGKDFGGDAWQYTGSGLVPGIAGWVDRSVWQGSPADLGSLFDIAPPKPPVPPSPPREEPLMDTIVWAGFYWRTFISDGGSLVVDAQQVPGSARVKNLDSTAGNPLPTRAPKFTALSFTYLGKKVNQLRVSAVGALGAVEWIFTEGESAWAGPEVG